MTKITIYKADPKLYGFRVEGHALSTEDSVDLVCAAVSVLAQSIVLAMDEVVGLRETEYKLEVDETIPIIEFVQTKDLDDHRQLQVEILLKTFETAVKGILKEEQYRPYISLLYRRWNDD